MMSFVCGVIADSSDAGSMVNVSGSTSTNTGRAPFSRMASPVAMNVLETVPDKRRSGNRDRIKG